MKSAQIRQVFLDFFAQHQHQVVSSSSLVPGDDPTLLFTNAGMVQFKDTFLGKEKRAYTRATSSQRVVRAGGKHNDLENVGYTARHHTFFEMLGNFSFGDYFKQGAIQYAWEFLTQILKIPAEKLWITVHHSDQEAEDIWFNDIKIDPSRFSRLDEDNFWSMGDTGPCGPCTEIFYDHGPSVAGGPPGSPEEDGDRYIEIWNLVFMQYDRQPNGDLVPLPKPSVDTGMGFERIAAVLQGVHNNYEIDLFVDLINAICVILADTQQTTPQRLKPQFDANVQSLRVIADHIRACSFMIVDGVMPSNEGRGYVLRRIIRRAVRHGNKLGACGAFFFRCVSPLVDLMGEAFPELKKAQSNVEKILRLEEQRFAETLEQGLKILERDLAALSANSAKIIPGDTVFTLYDTYGFPVDLTADIARERGLTLDMDGFEAAMSEQKRRSRDSDQFANDYQDGLNLDIATDFTGYEHLKEQAMIMHLVSDAGTASELKEGDKGIVVVEKSPFYAESGGQVGDTGLMKTEMGSFRVENTTKEGETTLHHGVVTSGAIASGQKVELIVDGRKRSAIRLNHSATHLLHAALQAVLGDHVMQKGSLVDQDRLRFDFSSLDAVKPEALLQVERLVNQQIRANSTIQTEILPIEEAKAKGAMALFGEKYADTVRVLTMGNGFSIELCGGTHVTSTGEIGLFKIVSESGIAAGVRRIEAVTGEIACAYIEEQEQALRQIGVLVKSGREKVVARVEQLLSEQKELEKTLVKLKQKAASNIGEILLERSIKVGEVYLIAEHVGEVDAKALRTTIDQLKSKLERAVIVLATTEKEKVQIAVGVTKPDCNQVKAGELVNFIAQQVGGKGGGRPDMAMAGGNQPAAVEPALETVVPWVKERLLVEART